MILEHRFCEISEQAGLISAGAVSFFGGLIQAAVGSTGGIGATPLKQMGLAANSASSVMARCSVSAAAVPWWTAAGAIRPIPPFHCNSRLSRLKRIRARDLDGERFVSLDPKYLSRQKVDEVLHRSDVDFDVFMTTQTAISAFGMIKNGVGAAIVDPFTAAISRDQSLCVRPFSPAACFDYIAAVPQREIDHGLARALIDQVRLKIEAFQRQVSMRRR